MSTLAQLVRAAIERREALISSLAREGTDCFRVLHGAVEGRPGLTVDRYGPVLLVQTFREPLSSAELDEVTRAVSEGLGGVELSRCWNHRGPQAHAGLDESFSLEAPIATEGDARYVADARHRGQDPLLFLDFRAGRRVLRARAQGRSVLNLFAYTCGVGVAAMLGGATRVLNVDFAASALAIGRRNATLNQLDEHAFETLEENVLPVIRQLGGLEVRGRGKRARRFTKVAPRHLDLIVLDPPRWAKTPFGAIDVVRDYASLFKPCVLACAEGGAVLATNHVPHVDLEEWLDSLRRCATKAGRPLRDIEVIAPDADFPSPDQRPPLKLAYCHV